MAFIALEGVEGSGKSTQTSLLAKRLREHGVAVVTTREPGGTERGEMIRSLLLDPGHGPLSERAEALLYAADRAEHVESVIRPALSAGSWVVCDRYSDSYRAYQGGGRELGIAEVGQISSWASNGLEPDLVVVLDLPIEAGMKRITRSRDRIESAGAEFHARVREAFLNLASTDPSRFRVLDASQQPEEVADLVWEAVIPLTETPQ